VISPASTLATQRGDCFDISTLLVSLLVGAGYNAYCVCGYATKNVTLNNQTVRACPEAIEPEEKAIVAEKKVWKPSKYKIKTRPNLTSTFLQMQKDKAAKPKDAAIEEQKQAEAVEHDEHHNNRVHYWVLVLPNQRDVKQPFFIGKCLKMYTILLTIL